ncbi:MAG TPA: hypothetical protein VNW97_03280 [Candidatus Saccharimonadales bacterium]|jgi:hypothetical protein|nr:hypothetical protein [Candidatus Saccharimonadales bacterium]
MIKVADEIWLATSLLHRENPGRQDFSVIEIVERVMSAGLEGKYRPGLQVHASTHCVATKSPNPARHRMLSETGRGRRRLFRPGDKFHCDRSSGKTHPDPKDIPQKYRYLLDWYEHDYVEHKNGASALPPGGSPAALLKMAGSISKQDLKRMKTAIEEGCERIDADEWQLPARH